MAHREVIFLGTSSQVPTRSRNHNALFVRFDELGFLVDPGEGTQRQLIHAGISVSQITHILITHFHGDHCLGLAGIVQRISLDRVPHTIEVVYPSTGQIYLDRLRASSIFDDHSQLRPIPVSLAGAPGDGLVSVPVSGALRLFAHPLEHSVDCIGYRLEEDGGRRMKPELLQAHGLKGEQIRTLVQRGLLERPGLPTVTMEEVSEPREGQSFAVVMDTRLCAGTGLLARGVDLLVSESTYLDEHQAMAHDHFHMTGGEAARLAAEVGVRRLVLTHFSQRYTELDGFREEASRYHGDVRIAEDLERVEFPARRSTKGSG